jgi:drug/metabolite transporter (DMT)-like permease
MASQPQGPAEELIARIEASRNALAGDLAALRRRLDVPTRVRDSFRSRPLAWFGGSLGAGLLASMLFKRPRQTPARPVPARRGWWGMMLGGAFTLARPALQSWAIKELQNRFVIPRNDNAGKS